MAPGRTGFSIADSLSRYHRPTQITGQSIPWPPIPTEGAAIVVSILLAFAIDAARQHRGEVAEEREILVGLEAGYVGLRDRLEYWAQMNRRGLIGMSAGDHDYALTEAGELLALIRARLAVRSR